MKQSIPANDGALFGIDFEVDVVQPFAVINNADVVIVPPAARGALVQVNGRELIQAVLGVVAPDALVVEGLPQATILDSHHVEVDGALFGVTGDPDLLENQALRRLAAARAIRQHRAEREALEQQKIAEAEARAAEQREADIVMAKSLVPERHSDWDDLGEELRESYVEQAAALRRGITAFGGLGVAHIKVKHPKS